MASTYFIQTSNDEGKTFQTVGKTTSRDRAFDMYIVHSEDSRTKMYKDNTLMLTTHLADAVADVEAYANH